jgi:hypothetical protein
MTAAPLIRLLATSIVLTAAPARGAAPVVPDRISRGDDQGMQAQTPIWGPGAVDRPRLTYEVNDRDRQIHLRIAERVNAEWQITDVGLLTAGTPRSFLLSEDRVDNEVAWANPHGFYFARTLDAEPELYYFDVAPHRVELGLTGIEDPDLTPDASALALAAHDASGAEMYRIEVGDWGSPRRLTWSPAVVEHGPSWCPDGRLLLFVATDHEQTSLEAVRVAGPRIVGPIPLLAGPGEILAVECSPSPGRPEIALYTRTESGRHALVVIDHRGAQHHRIEDVHVEPGHAPRPAWSPGGRYLLFVAEDAGQANPVRALDSVTGDVFDIPLTTRGHLEASVGGWLAEGVPRIGLAVVAVGAEGSGDLRNHLYFADVTELLIDDR